MIDSASSPVKQGPMMQTWILFENSEYAEIDLSIHVAPAESPRPADAYVVTERGGFARSAQRAAEAVYGWLKKTGRNSEPFVAAFDLLNLSMGSITGESGGLSFAIALAGKLLGGLPAPVAATGVIAVGHGDGPVTGVQGIEAKLATAIQLVPENGLIFYPVENDFEISEPLRNAILEKGIRLQPVVSAAQALDLLFGKTKKNSMPVRYKKAIMFALLCTALGLGLLLQLTDDTDTPPEHVSRYQQDVHDLPSIQEEISLPAVVQENYSSQSVPDPDQLTEQRIPAKKVPSPGHGFE